MKSLILLLTILGAALSIWITPRLTATSSTSTSLMDGGSGTESGRVNQQIMQHKYGQSEQMNIDMDLDKNLPPDMQERLSQMSPEMQQKLRDIFISAATGKKIPKDKMKKLEQMGKPASRRGSELGEPIERVQSFVPFAEAALMPYQQVQQGQIYAMDQQTPERFFIDPTTQFAALEHGILLPQMVAGSQTQYYAAQAQAATPIPLPVQQQQQTQSACGTPSIPPESLCTTVPSTVQSFSTHEALAAAGKGWNATWVSLETGAELKDPLYELEEWQHLNQASTFAATGDQQPGGPYTWPTTFDRIFDAEQSEFLSSNSGWSDPSVAVVTDLGACRGMNQPGHTIFCARPGSTVGVRLGVKNTGRVTWTTQSVKIRPHRLDQAVWMDPSVLPAEIGIDVSAVHEEEGFHTSAAAAESYTHALSSDAEMKLIWTDGTHTEAQHARETHGEFECVEIQPGDSAVYEMTLTTPQVEGLYPMRFSIMSPCGRLMKPLRINLQATCSDGIFCNGLERMDSITGVCETPSTNQVLGCDDKDSCTVDQCDEMLGRCKYSLLNSTECIAGAGKICGGDRCVRSCPKGTECGSDGCGGSCGICPSGTSCAGVDYHNQPGIQKCLPAAHTTASCVNPLELNVFASMGQEEAWKKDPLKFGKGGLTSPDAASSSGAESSFPSELSRRFLLIPNVSQGTDGVTPACVSFGTRPDFIWRFTVPENGVIDSKNASLTPLQVNLDPSQSVLKRAGYIGLTVQAYGKYNPRIDTVVEVRGVPGVFHSSHASSTSGTASGDDTPVIDPTIFSCLDDPRKVNGTKILHVSSVDGTQSESIFTVDTQSELYRQHTAILDSGSTTATGVPFKPFSMCNDNATPPGGVGSHLSVLLPPGTYFLIVSTYPRFNIPASVQEKLDGAAAPPLPGATPDQLQEVEAFLRFTSGYLPDCTNLACGDDGGGNECGLGCPQGQICSQAAGKCVPSSSTKCLRDCTGRQCGSDGCGGSCGRCRLSSLPQSTLLSTPNPLGIPFSSEDVYCVEERDPSVAMSGPAERNYDSASKTDNFSTASSLGTSSCALLPKTCDGSRPICHGLPSTTPSGKPMVGCPSGMFCANNCTCLPKDVDLPDLLVHFEALTTQIMLSSYSFSNRSCSLVEKCIQRPGIRKLLRFTVAIVNQGRSDLTLPKPREQPDEFVYSPCHHHFHYHHFADYSLIQEGQVKQRGHKQAFCLEDSNQELIGANVPCLAHHTCTSPGIQRGWTDYYGADLDCQWIDVTDLDPGKYLLRIEVNSARQLLESSFENNAVVVEITIPKIVVRPLDCYDREMCARLRQTSYRTVSTTCDMLATTHSAVYSLATCLLMVTVLEQTFSSVRMQFL